MVLRASTALAEFDIFGAKTSECGAALADLARPPLSFALGFHMKTVFHVGMDIFISLSTPAEKMLNVAWSQIHVLLL